MHPEAFGASLQDEADLCPSVIAQRLERGLVLGGFRDGQSLDGIAGIAKSTSEKVRHIATIWGMYLRPSARGSGLAKQLLNAAIAEASRDCRSIRLSVVATNQAAYRLYENAGFKQWAVDRESLCVDGHFHDEILMRLDP